MSVYTLGINCYLHDTSSALARDGVVIFAGAEERFSRIKKDHSFPKKSIQAALSFAGIGPKDIDAVAFGWNKPTTTPMHTLKCALTGKMPFSFAKTAPIDIIYDIRHQGGKKQLLWDFPQVAQKPISFVDHHLAHAYSAYNVSGLEDAIVLVVDGRGAFQATSIYHGHGDSLKLLRHLPYPNSLGMLYESFTDFLGFERHNDEWKVMGLAAYGEPTYDMSSHVRPTEDGYEVFPNTLQGKWWNDISPLTAKYGARRNPEREITQDDMNLAASVQKATEEALFSLVRSAQRQIKSRNLCLAGGVAMNSKANGKLIASGLIDQIFIQPAATDDGTAYGAALVAYHDLTGKFPRYEMTNAYLGPEYSQQEIEDELAVCKIPYSRHADISAVAARLLMEGNILGWFQGRMEFGPRALGNRSILADPRDPLMKDKVNQCIKFRETWRPFAPATLIEKRTCYFEPDNPSPFMILTHTVKEEMRAALPSITHADKSARIQTVIREENPRYYDAIAEFGKLTGISVLMNTSFNLRGEPIVCTPKDAIRTFYSSGMDYLVLGECLVAKNPAQ